MTAAGHVHLSEPASWVVRWAPRIAAGGAVLDLACGSGRHARHLAALGLQVEAVDKDAVALAGLQGLRGIDPVVADLEAGMWPYGGRRFDAIIVTNYLHRPLFPWLMAALAPGGLLIYETFRQGNESYGRPSNPAFLLAPQELLVVARDGGLQVVAFEDGFSACPKPAMVQRLCAQKPPLRMPEEVRLE